MAKVKYSFAQWCRDNGHEDWLDLWDYELNNVGPEDVAYKSSCKKYWFKCSRGIHKSELKDLNNITSNRSRLFCNQCCSFGQWLLDTFGDGALNKYWSDKNTISPMSIASHSKELIWIKCVNDNRHPDYLISPDKFVSHQCGCSVCAGRTIISGINDVATTHPQYVKYFRDKNDATKYSIHSTKSVWFKCPYCEHEKYIKIDSAFRNDHYSCPICGDGFSYANKFIYCMLKQLQKNKYFLLKPEKVFQWSKNLLIDNSKRKYDFYINNGDDIIIEANGAQHYERGFDVTCGGRAVNEEQENDLFKYNLAINNGIKEKNYIALDCRESNLDFIKKSVMNSNLPMLLGFYEHDINWIECEKFALSNLVIKICELWKSGIRDLKNLANEVDIGVSTVSLYLQKGDKLGLIIYESKSNKPIIYNYLRVLDSPSIITICKH